VIATVMAQAAPGQAIPAPAVDWPALVPLLILVGAGVLLLTVASLVKPLPSWFPTVWTALAGVASIVATIPLWVDVHHHGGYSTLSSMFGVDGFSIFITMLIGSAVVLTALLADDFLRREALPGLELYVLLLLSASGGVIMASANDLIVLFLGLEVLSIAVYVMAAMNLRRIQSQEAGLKYFVLGGFSSAFFLYGIALTYGATGSTNLVSIKDYLSTNVLTQDAMLLAGMALLLVGLGFKVAAVPFQSWTPDVYQGAPSPVTAFMASGVKVAGFAALLRVFSVTFSSYADDWKPAVYALAVLTLLFGSIVALTQSDVKRMMAYSSISHAGFILVGVQAATDRGTSAALFYLAAYTFLVAGSFAIITVVGRRGDARHSLSDYRGLASEKPVLAFAFTVLLASQAGVPFTTGFFAKFEVIEAAMEAHSYWLGLVAMLSAVSAAYLYLRIIITLYGPARDPEAVEADPVRVPVGAAAVIVVAVAVTVAFGIVPHVIDNLARDAVPTVVASAQP
jgi:NADH-quinone oxidoreductase subunit N